MPNDTEGTLVALRFELSDKAFRNQRGVGNKIYFFPKECESLLPQIFHTAIVRPHPARWEEDFYLAFVKLQTTDFYIRYAHPYRRGGDQMLLERMGFSLGRKDIKQRAKEVRDILIPQYSRYISVVPLLALRRRSKTATKEGDQWNDSSALQTPYLGHMNFAASSHLSKTKAGLIHAGKTYRPLCHACTFLALNLSGDCAPLDDVCRSRMSIAGLGLASQTNQEIEQRIDQFEGEFYGDLSEQLDSPSGISDNLELRPAAGHRLDDPGLPPGDPQRDSLVAAPESK